MRTESRRRHIKTLTTPLPIPRLTFACELNPARLTTLFADTAVIADLQALRAHVALMLSDLSAERAAAVQQLNAANIPVVAIPLLPRLGDKERPLRARAAYGALIDRMHVDGYGVETYQFPLIADERKTGSTLLQRVMGMVNVQTDREVWMLYTSFFPGISSGLLWNYAPEAEAIGVGSTGGGPDIPGSPQVPSLDWEAFSRDLRLARHWCDDLYVHSLEGCVRQGFLERLRDFDWDRTVEAPRAALIVGYLRHVLRAALWAGEHPWRMLAALAVAGWLMSRGSEVRDL